MKNEKVFDMARNLVGKQLDNGIVFHAYVIVDKDGCFKGYDMQDGKARLCGIASDILWATGFGRMHEAASKAVFGIPDNGYIIFLINDDMEFIITIHEDGRKEVKEVHRN